MKENSARDEGWTIHVIDEFHSSNRIYYCFDFFLDEVINISGVSGNNGDDVLVRGLSHTPLGYSSNINNNICRQQ